MATNASVKPRGRPPANSNSIVWTDHLVATLLRLRFEKYAEPMTSPRGTKPLQGAWRDLAEEISQENNGEVVSIVQCRNKLKALRNKWLAYRAGVASAPVDLTLMDNFWGGDNVKHEKIPRSSPEPKRHTKRPKLNTISTQVDAKQRSFIAPVPVSKPEERRPEDASAAVATLSATSEVPTQSGADILTVKPFRLRNAAQGSDIASDIAEAARPKNVETTDLSNLDKLMDDRFREVLERQEKQLRLTEVQNKLLARVLATLESGNDDQSNE